MTVVTRHPQPLILEPAPYIELVGKGRRVLSQTTHFLDFVVDGQRATDMFPFAKDMTTLLNPWVSMISESIPELLGNVPVAALSEGRIRLLVCGSCGDLACGAATATLNMTKDSVTWSDFMWEDGYRPARYIENLPDGIVFDKRTYEEALSGVPERLAALPSMQVSDVTSEHKSTAALPWHLGRKIMKRRRWL